MSQQQDLIFFSDNSIVSDRCLASQNIQIFTHNEGTSPSWLLTAVIENGLVGTANLVNRELNRKIRDRASVTVASFVHNRDFWVSACKKQGVDLDSTQNINYVDCLTELFTKQITNTEKLKVQVEKLFGGVIASIQKQKLERKIAILENPEILLAATDISANDMIQNLRKLAATVNTLIVVLNTDSPLLNFSTALPEDPVTKITDFYVKLHHLSSLNINILPLATGRAKDITGCLTVARGAKPAPLAVVEKEYIFHLSKDSVKLYFR